MSKNHYCFLLYLLFNGNLVIDYGISQLNKWYRTFLIKNKIYCVCRYILDQKDAQSLLIHIRNILKFGSVYLRKETDNVHRLVVSMNNPKRINFLLLIDYFKKFPLKTTKTFNFELWCNVIDIIKLKEHNTEKGLIKIRKLITRMNKYTLEYKSNGSSKFS